MRFTDIKNKIKRKCKIYQYNHVETSIIVDFNNGEFYNEKVDIIFCSGILEYIYNIESFIKNISNNTDIVIFSYNFIENVPNRASIWVNAYNKKDLLTIFNKCGFVNIILLSDLKYFKNSVTRNSDTVCIVSKASFNTDIVNFNVVNEVKFNEYFINLNNKIDKMYSISNNIKNDEYLINLNNKIDRINKKIDKIVDALAWWIPFKKKCNEFRNNIKK